MTAAPRIIVLAKAPAAGLAKTRLIPALGAEGSARLAAMLLDHAVEQALTSGIGPVELCVSPAPQDPRWADLLPKHPALQLSDQGNGDLGERMARAAQRALAAGQPVLLMGTDSPGLNADRLRVAAQQLRHHDTVLAPAFDGGYVLLGLRRFDPSLFSGIAWSTASVADATRERIERLGWSLARMPTLHDIDEPDDLRWLPGHWRAGGPPPG
jgi:uncharacterized protein